jgi:hypothetical protein
MCHDGTICSPVIGCSLITLKIEHSEDNELVTSGLRACAERVEEHYSPFLVLSMKAAKLNTNKLVLGVTRVTIGRILTIASSFCVCVLKEDTQNIPRCTEKVKKFTELQNR